VILKFPPPYFSKLVQSKAHWMRQRAGARNPGLRSPPLLSACHSTSSGLLVGPYEVGGVVVVVTTPGTAVVVGGELVTVVSGVATSWSPRQPSMAAIAASPMTPARMTDQRR
jgi:hypothetical protein